MKVLVVDDEENVRKGIATFLELSGHEAVAVADLASALRANIASSYARFGAAADLTIGPAAAAAAGIPFTISQVLSLAPGVAYWFDLALSTSNPSDSAIITNISVTLADMP